jgi:hypothetical protein
MEAGVRTFSDPWGIEASKAERAPQAGSPERTSKAPRRGPGRTLRRVVLPALLVAGTAAATVPAVATVPPGLAHPHGSVPIISGNSALYSVYEVVSASAAGAVVLYAPRNGNGQPVPDYSTVYFLGAGKTSLQALTPVVASGYVPQNQEWMSGDLVLSGENSSTRQAVWWYNTSTHKSGTSVLPSGQYVSSSAPNGLVISNLGYPKATVSYDDIATGKITALGSFKYFESATGGTSGAVVTSNAGVQYVTYSPVKTTTLSTDKSLGCFSITTNAVGCQGETSVVRFPLPSGKAVNISLKTEPGQVIVTPKATAWASCSSSSCSLTREPAAGGSQTSFKIASIALGGSNSAGGMTAIGDDYVWGELFTDSADDGIYELSDTSTSAKHIISVGLSPIAAADVAVSGNTVYYLDNARSGLSIYRR